VELDDLVAELTDLIGPSGAEAPVQDRIEQLWAELGLSPRRTPTATSSRRPATVATWAPALAGARLTH
jgi:hypothetical protein